MNNLFTLTGLDGFYIFLIGLVTTAAYLGLFRRLDTYRDRKDQSWTYLGFFLGGWFSTIPVSFLYSVIGHEDWLNTSQGSAAFYYFINGPVEEFGKMVVFLFLVQSTRALKEPVDGVILGACIGLGFAVAENLEYAAAYGNDVGLMWERSIYGIIGHPVYTAFTAAVLSFGVFGLRGRDGKLKWPLVFLAWLPLSWIHSTHNFLADFSPAFRLPWEFLWFGILALVFVYMKNQSPYRPMNLSLILRSRDTLKRGLAQWPESPTLNRRSFLAAYHNQDFDAAVRHWKRMEPLIRSADVRRVGSAVIAYLCDDKEVGREKIKAYLRRHPFLRDFRSRLWDAVASFFPKGREDLAQVFQLLGTLERENNRDIHDKALEAKRQTKLQSPRQVLWKWQNQRRKGQGTGR